MSMRQASSAANLLASAQRHSCHRRGHCGAPRLVAGPAAALRLRSLPGGRQAAVMAVCGVLRWACTAAARLPHQRCQCFASLLRGKRRQARRHSHLKEKAEAASSSAATTASAGEAAAGKAGAATAAAGAAAAVVAAAAAATAAAATALPQVAVAAAAVAAAAGVATPAATEETQARGPEPAAGEEKNGSHMGAGGAQAFRRPQHRGDLGRSHPSATWRMLSERRQSRRPCAWLLGQPSRR